MSNILCYRCAQAPTHSKRNGDYIDHRMLRTLLCRQAATSGSGVVGASTGSIDATKCTTCSDRHTLELTIHAPATAEPTMSHC